MYFVVTYAFFGVNFILQKFCLYKKNDKYEVCDDGDCDNDNDNGDNYDEDDAVGL